MSENIVKTKSFKDLATSLASVVFFVVGISGVMLYFHIFDAGIKELHEILGLVFVGAALLHIIANWRQMKTYFSKKVFIVAALGAILVSVSLIDFSKADKPNPKKIIINSVLQAPIEDAVDLLGSDMATVKTKFQKEGIEFENAISIQEVAKQNITSPFRIVDIILEK